MKKILSILLIVFLVFPLSSCRYKDIDRRGFIVAIGLDAGKSKDEFEISVKVAIPKSQQGGLVGGNDEPNFILYQTSDKSIAGGLRRIKGQMSLDPDYSHLKAVVLGEGITEYFSLNEIVDYFVRRTDIQEIAWLLVGKPSALAIVSHMPLGENVAGNYLFLKFGQGVQPQFVNITEIHEVFSEMNIPGVSISCPVIELKDQHFNADNTAIFHDGKFNMILDREQTRMLNILEIGLKVGFITTFGDEKKPIGIRMQSAGGKISLKENPDDDIDCNIDIKIIAMLEESSDTYHDTAYFEKKFEELFTNHTRRLMSTLQSNGLDPLALQVKYWAQHPEYKFSKDWLTEVYPNIKFNVNSKVTIYQKEIIK
jgi:spore germination protein KC